MGNTREARGRDDGKEVRARAGSDGKENDNSKVFEYDDAIHHFRVDGQKNAWMRTVFKNAEKNSRFHYKIKCIFMLLFLLLFFFLPFVIIEENTSNIDTGE